LKKITVGIIATLKQRAEELRAKTTETGLATTIVQVCDCCAKPEDWSTRQLIDADPEIILIQDEDYTAALQTLQVLQSAVPNARLLITSSITDPQIIIELMRAGVREVLPSPLPQPALVQAFNRYLSEKARAITHTKARVKRGKIYCVTTAKPGCGATTLAVNLAAAPQL
jgi:DNA-binding NarL/FixJ family response regulator